MKKFLFLLVALVGLPSFAYADCACTKDKCACMKKICENGNCRFVHDCKCPATDSCKTVCKQCGAKSASDECAEQSWKYYQSSIRVKGLGSGTVIDCYENDKGKFVCFVLSCWHIVDKNPKAVTIETFWPKRESFTGYILASDPSKDLSLMIFQSDHPVAFTPLAVTDSIQVGDRITTLGCPELSEPVGYFANVSGFSKSDMSFSRGTPTYLIDHPSTGGHSGGGMFKNDFTIGVLVASDRASHSELIATEVCRTFYETTLQKNTPACLLRWIFGRHRNPGGKQPGYEGPPATVPPDISLTPRPVDPPVPVYQEPVPVYSEPEDTRNPFALPSMFAALFGGIAAVIEFYKRVS